MATPTPLFAFLLLVASSMAKPSEREMTVQIAGGTSECFFETLDVGETLDVDYQVVDGGRQNDLTIDFKVLRPSNGIPLFVDVGKSDNAHRVTVDEAGDFKLCFDNSRSRFSDKIVFFELIVEGDEDGEGAFEYGDDVVKVADSDYVDVKVEDIEEALRAIKDKVTRSRHFQDQIRAHEFRDRSVAERNFERVNFWSSTQLALMLAAGVVQVVLVRSLFDEKSFFHKLWSSYF